MQLKILFYVPMVLSWGAAEEDWWSHFLSNSTQQTPTQVAPVEITYPTQSKKTLQNCWNFPLKPARQLKFLSFIFDIFLIMLLCWLIATIKSVSVVKCTDANAKLKHSNNFIHFALTLAVWVLCYSTSVSDSLHVRSPRGGRFCAGCVKLIDAK